MTTELREAPPADLAPVAFQMPPVLHNARGDLRRAGFEFEYAGIGVEASADLVRDVFGGDLTILGPAVRKVGTPIGDFSVEIDSAVVKDKRYEVAMRAVGLNPDNWNTDPLEAALTGVLSTWVPFEVGTPPIPLDRLSLLDDLRERLRLAGAKGTRTSFRYAFGMHINPELTSDDAADVRDHLRAFLLLLPWLSGRVDVDLTRRVMPFINPFPIDYARLVLQPDYPADAGRLIDDYLKFNPTRNRPLDLLPVLAHLDKDRVMHRVEDPHLVKPRPAYHYRLPNCLIDEPGWTIAREWNTWVAVERLAADKPQLAEM
ncbi:MAG TPA: amidoligase family protein, partial [Humisphaera sp.]